MKPVTHQFNDPFVIFQIAASRVTGANEKNKNLDVASKNKGTSQI
jgi:hypothetical protein